MDERYLTPRLLGSIIATAIVVVMGWALTYEFAISYLTSHGSSLFSSLISEFDLTSMAWWRNLISLAFDLLIVIIAIVGTWWVLGHLALEAREAGKWRRYYGSSEAKRDVWVERFSAWQRIQHIWIMVTFFVCACTGLAVHWNLADRALLFSIHVYSGIIMGVLVILHFTQYTAEALMWKRSGESLRSRFPMLEIYSKKFLKNLVRELARTVKGRRESVPHGKYNSEQLFEYWGVYWGIIVLGIPGVIMALYGPGVLGGVLFTMHFKEAILAVTFIVLVHLGYGHFRPSVFPMDPTYIHGKMPLKRIKEEHPAWAEDIIKGAGIKEAFS